MSASGSEHATGSIVAGALAPHPPHLVYAENPPQNEPRAECGWEELRWGYERLRRSLDAVDFDVIVVLSPHWQTYVGTHFLGVERLSGKSVDPIFPNLFRYTYDLEVDVPLAQAIHDAAHADGLVTKMMRNPSFRVDYGTLVSCHMVRPQWDKPIVAISSNRNTHYYGVDVMQAQARALGIATRRAIEASGKRALLLSSNSLSHRHFTSEPNPPEDMSAERAYDHHQYLWDMRVLGHIREGRTRQLVDEMPELIEHAVAEADAGGMEWLLSALDYPTTPGDIHAYGHVIGTGNAVVGWIADAGGAA